METCTLQEIKEFAEAEELFSIASKSKHPNASNFDVNKMKKRWGNYLVFNILRIDDTPISFGGVYKYSDTLARVADRLYTFEKFRQTSFTKNVVEQIRPAVDFFIPTHTKYAKKLGYECFYSIGPEKKKSGIERVTRLIDKNLGYRVLPGYYATCNPALYKCWQSIASTTDTVDLPKRLDKEFV